jgi:hypothetical protein
MFPEALPRREVTLDDAVRKRAIFSHWTMIAVGPWSYQCRGHAVSEGTSVCGRLSYVVPRQKISRYPGAMKLCLCHNR